MPKYIINILIGLDQLLNAFALGDPDETISSRLGRNFPNSILAKTVNTLFFWDKNHCKNSIEEGEGDDAITR